jgi:ribosomal protein L31
MSDVPNRAHDENRAAPNAHTMMPTQDVLEGMFASVNAPMVKDPFTGTVHVDLSDPNHPFWKGGPRD